MRSGASIRVLYLQPAAHFGGAERQAATIVPFLRELGVDTIPLVGPGRAIVEWLEERGVDDYVFTRNFPGAVPARGSSRVSLPADYVRCWTRCRAELAQLLRDQAIDIVFAAMAFSWIVATPVARKLGIPVVWRAGGTECAPAVRYLLSAWARRSPPDLLVCNGDAVRRMYGPLIGAPALTIRNGIDDEQFYPGAGDHRALRPPGARVVIGFAGRLVPQKRPEDFIAAAARFVEHDDVAFLIAGDGSRREAYEDQARLVGARNLRVLGFVRDMRDFYAACDVLVLPSRSEGCPNVVLEAMAMKTAVVAADMPATREIVTTGADGILYPIGQIDALATALASVIERPHWRTLLVERAYRRVCQLTARACATRTAQVLRAVAGDRSSARLPATTARTALRS